MYAQGHIGTFVLQLSCKPVIGSIPRKVEEAKPTHQCGTWHKSALTPPYVTRDDTLDISSATVAAAGESMLNSWLDVKLREPCQYRRFTVVDTRERHSPTDEIRAHVCDLLLTARFDREYLASMAKKMGWDAVQAGIIAAKLPRTRNAKRGEFGESLVISILEQLFGYRVPVPKLRYKMTSDQSLPATDALALRLDDGGEITEVCFVESKLRTTHDDAVGLEGHGQLLQDYQARLPAILEFTAARLYERHDELFNTFSSYLRDRQDTTSKDTFCLSLCWEETTWREAVLQNLEEGDIEGPRLTVHATRIAGLRTLTDEVFAQIGITEVSDE